MKTKSSLPVHNILGHMRPEIDPSAIFCQFMNSEIFSVVAPFIYKVKPKGLNRRKHQKNRAENHTCHPVQSDHSCAAGCSQSQQCFAPNTLNLHS